MNIGGSKDSSHDIANEYYISYKKLIYKHYGFFYSRTMMMFMYLKILSKILRLQARPSLVKLALMGFPERLSLRYKQKSKYNYFYMLYKTIFHLNVF
jgi:hypothetical protein